MRNRRRAFHTACWITVTAATALLCAAVVAADNPDPLAQGFAAPPQTARLRAYWWWLNGNVNKAAITRDLEWMKAIGMGGALVFDAGGPAGPVPTGPLFGSPEWRELFRHALREADRLGLELTLSPQSGWNLGGPTVKPEQATKHVAWSEIRVQGPAKFAAPLAVPKHRDGFYRDTRLLAYRLKDSDASQPARPEITASSFQPGRQPEVMLDGDSDTFWVSSGKEAGQGPSVNRPEWVALRFTQPTKISGVRIVPRAGYGPQAGEWQSSEDGKKFTRVQAFTVKKDRPLELRFPEMTSRHYRLLIHGAFDRLMPQSPRNVQVAELGLLGPDGQPLGLGRRRPIRQLEAKAVFHELGGSAPDCSPLLDDVPAEPGEEDVAAKDVLDLTRQFNEKDGTFRWDVPEGTWQVLRFGYTTNGSRGHVSTSSGDWRGLVVDYLDADALKSYWHQIVEPLVADAGPLAGKVLKGFETDSWEAGGINWTPGLPEEFRKRRGYDLTPYLPVIAGKIVESRDASNRFLADFRKTIADCMADNHYAVMAELARKHGMMIHCEAGGPHAGPFDGLKNLGRCEAPMGEFWVPSPHRPTEETRFFMKVAASAAHIYGKRIACGEGFTSIGPHWNDVLWSAQKPSFDHEACAGLNLVYWHAFTCSPPEMGVPGQQYFAGTHFDPNITWAKQAPAFVAYLNRCQFLLQQGQFVADVCYYCGDHVPNIVGRKQADPAKVLPQYDYDVVNEEVLLTRMSVKDGRIVLPGGMSYRVLVLPNLMRPGWPKAKGRPTGAGAAAADIDESPFAARDSIKVMSPAALRKIDDLVQAGAVVIGPRPERTATLQDYPACDAELKRLADELWGKGRIASDKTAREVLARLGVPPDFEADSSAGLDYIHRRDGETEIYFVSNPKPEPVSVQAVFRVSGKQPELWDPVSGERRDAAAFQRQGGRTRVPLEFGPYGSLFVVFRRPAAADGRGRNFPTYTEVAELAGPWAVSFDPKWGGPQSVQFDKLISWTKRPEEGIRFYSGTATYRKTFDRPVAAGRLVLDLGEVMNIAEVRLNGETLGIVWTPPFRVDITAALQPAGNRLEIDVVNTWYNRLIKDQALPPEERLTRTNVRLKPDASPAESGLLGPVRILSVSGAPQGICRW